MHDTLENPSLHQTPHTDGVITEHENEFETGAGRFQAERHIDTLVDIDLTQDISENLESPYLETKLGKNNLYKGVIVADLECRVKDKGRKSIAFFDGIDSNGQQRIMVVVGNNEKVFELQPNKYEDNGLFSVLLSEDRKQLALGKSHRMHFHQQDLAVTGYVIPGPEAYESGPLIASS